MFLISNAYAQTAAPAAESGFGQLLLPLAMIVVLFFVMVRPQMKRAKEQKALLAGLAKGDEVVTTGGVIGRIAKLDDNFVTLQTGTNVELQIQRSAVVQILPKGTLK